MAIKKISRPRSSKRRSTSQRKVGRVVSSGITARSREPQPPAHLFAIREKQVLFRGDAARATGAERTVDLRQYRPDDVIEVTLDNGVRLYTTFSQYLNDFPPERSRDATKPGQYVLPLILDADGPSRGGAGLAVKFLKLLGVDPIETGATFTARELSEWYERRQLKSTDGEQQRLWLCDTGPRMSFALTKAVKDSDIPTNKPVLVFLHGTASSTAGSFSGLWAEEEGADVRTDLFSQYGGHVYGFEHRTLTESPIENVLALLEYLPKSARVHVISHSRGGLVGELLCRGQRQGADPFTKEDIEFAYSRATAAEQQHATLIRQLNTKLKEKRITVERFVRVACPTRGTNALDERLDRWLSVTLNLLDYVLPPGLADFHDIFKEFALALIKTRTKPEELPGLQSMVPESALIRLLNAPDASTGEPIRVDADLHVVAGDIEGGSWLKRLGVWVTDQFYDSQHDLIVHTPAMYGGASRSQERPSRFYMAQGEQVNHFSYFTRTETRHRLVDGLTKPPGRDGYESFDPATKQRSMREARARAPMKAPVGPRPIVVVIPGIMGSELEAGGKQIWLSGRLLFGRLNRLAIDSKEVVRATAPIALAYSDLISFLGASHEVVPFPYDWRLSLRTEATRLRDTLSTLIAQAEQQNQPVSIIAHSMGGLLARVFIAEHEATWQRLIRHRDARLIMLGTPNVGSHAICRVLTGREPLLRGLAAVDMKHSAKQVVDMVKRFPGLLEMLPTYQSDIDFFAHGTWQQLAYEDDGRWTPPDPDDLARAKQTRELLDRQIAENKLPLDRILYIAGTAERTPVVLKRGVPPPPPHVNERWPGPEADGRIYFEATTRGDGRVPWEGGILKGMTVWYSEAAHGDLADNEDDFPAILDLLKQGTTSLLPQQPPTSPRRAAVGPTIVMRPRKLERHPDDELLVSLALEKRETPKRRVRLPRLNVGVAHGNLIYTQHPVVVGHYQGDTIISSEAVLDQQLDGRLTMRRALDLYPGPIGTCEVFLNPQDKFPGAVVVGLGRVGELTSGKLMQTFARGVLEYALRERERTRRDDDDEILAVRLSTLLIGTTAGGLPVRDSLASLLRGVTSANRELSRQNIGIRVEYLEILELWEDRAIEAARLLSELRRDAELGQTFKCQLPIEPLRGRRKRAYYGEQRGWWERLQIVAGDRGELTFTRLTDRARAEVKLLPTQRGLVERYLEEVTRDTVTKPQVAHTLFELLLPNEIKDRTADERDVILVLDDHAARYPWELLEDGLARDRNGDFVTRDSQNATDGVKPLAVRAGLIRQRMSDVYRPEPRMSMGNVAFVVGNPALHWEEMFADLPGATAEATSVADTLRAARGNRELFDVVDCIATDPHEIVNTLFTRPYRILHLAGHGVHNFVAQGEAALHGWLEGANVEGRSFRLATGEENEGNIQPWFRVEHAPNSAGTRLFQFRQGELVSGMVIGRNVFLTPREIQQMRVVPELVFINCCFGGKDEAPPRDRSQLAANLATQLIEMGVRVVIAAGWAVDDAAAQLFAETFYEAMLGGEAFGRAVHRARAAVYTKYENTVNTWGAYQCYGDPDYRLIDRGVKDDDDEEIDFVGEAEAVAAVDNLYQHALTARASNVSWLKERLPKLEKVALALWPGSGTLRTALGRAYGELDMFGEAIRNYETALANGTADVNLKALEQLSNLKARQAEVLARKAFSAGEKNTDDLRHAHRLIDEAEDLLNKLIELRSPKTGKKPSAKAIEDELWSTATTQRYTLMGSLYKRRIMIAALEGKDARDLLANMTSHYAKAEHIALLRDEHTDAYPILQQILAETLRARGDIAVEDTTPLLKKVQAVLDNVEVEKDKKREFWTRAHVADCVLARALIEGNLEGQAEAIIEHYRAAQTRGASLREWRSVLENLEFIRILVTSRWSNSSQSQILQALTRIYRGLEFFVDEGEMKSPLQSEKQQSRRARNKTSSLNQ